jgi:ABC-type amino acid transport substrate-binding protein
MGITHFPPCIFTDKGTPAGFDIDLWEAVAKGIGAKTEYVEIKDFSQTFDLLRRGQIDVAMSGITMTLERERMVDFSHPYLKSGICIVTLNKAAGHSGFSMESLLQLEVLESFLNSLRSAIIFQLAVTLLLLVLAVAHIVYLLERFGMPVTGCEIGKGYFSGITDAVYFVILSFATGFCNTEAKPAAARMLNVAVIAIGIGFFSVFTALLSANFTFEKIQPEVTGADDLADVLVASERGTSSIDAARQLGAEVIQVDSIDEAYVRLLDGEVKAVITDLPNALYFISHENNQSLVVLPDLLRTEYYAIAVRNNSRILEAINREILAMYEDGRYATIYNRWFKE